MLNNRFISVILNGNFKPSSTSSIISVIKFLRIQEDRETILVTVSSSFLDAMIPLFENTLSLVELIGKATTITFSYFY